MCMYVSYAQAVGVIEDKTYDQVVFYDKNFLGSAINSL